VSQAWGAQTADERPLPKDPGGLDMDGKLGPCTLTGLKYLLDSLPDPSIWQAAVYNAEIALGYTPAP
jgi:hypothetical protein